MNWKLNKPTKTGYYWARFYNPTTGMPETDAEVVYVCMEGRFRRKPQARVFARCWHAPFDEVINVEWSDEIICPF